MLLDINLPTRPATFLRDMQAKSQSVLSVGRLGGTNTTETAGRVRLVTRLLAFISLESCPASSINQPRSQPQPPAFMQRIDSDPS